MAASAPRSCGAAPGVREERAPAPRQVPHGCGGAGRPPTAGSLTPPRAARSSLICAGGLAHLPSGGLPASVNPQTVVTCRATRALEMCANHHPSWLHDRKGTCMQASTPRLLSTGGRGVLWGARARGVLMPPGVRHPPTAPPYPFPPFPPPPDPQPPQNPPTPTPHGSVAMRPQPLDAVSLARRCVALAPLFPNALARCLETCWGSAQEKATQSPFRLHPGHAVQ